MKNFYNTKNYNEDFIRNFEELGFGNSILEELSRTVKSCGFAGSTNIPELVYLVLLTGMLERPVSLVVKGPSGAGKSFALNAGKQFIPEKAYSQFEGMSEKALIYLTDLNLKHKHLVIGEAAGMAEGNGRVLLRQLLSEGKVTYATVQSTDKDGLTGSTLPTLEGPTGLLMTTTANTLHAEDESRMLSVSISESPEQIRSALLAQALGTNQQTQKPNLEKWHSLYEHIQSGPKEVVIPYAKNIVEGLPTSHDRIKRDFPQLLSLISAHALMHSFDRKWMDEGTVEANETDYENVYRLVNEPMSQGLDVTVSDDVRNLVEAVVTLDKSSRGYGGTSQTMLAKYLDRAQYAVSRTVKKAVKAGYLNDNNPGQGKRAQLTIGDRELPVGSVLPHPDDLFGRKPKQPSATNEAANSNERAKGTQMKAPW